MKLNHFFLQKKMFEQHHLSRIFALGDLQEGFPMEEVCCNGRLGATLVQSAVDDAGKRWWGLVRTTTKYRLPVCEMTAVHKALIREIQQFQPSASFNNVLVEAYDQNYMTMGFHTDQMQDLAKDSFICIYSYYSCQFTPDAPRILVIKDKETGKEKEIRMEHNSIILFSTDTNKQFTHKIIQKELSRYDDVWFGMTFRQSSTFITQTNGETVFQDGSKLTLATAEEAKQFYKLRQQENKAKDFSWPELHFTLNAGDLLPLWRVP